MEARIQVASAVCTRGWKTTKLPSPSLDSNSLWNRFRPQSAWARRKEIGGRQWLDQRRSWSYGRADSQKNGIQESWLPAGLLNCIFEIEIRIIVKIWINLDPIEELDPLDPKNIWIFIEIQLFFRIGSLIKRSRSYLPDPKWPKRSGSRIPSVGFDPPLVGFEGHFHRNVQPSSCVMGKNLFPSKAGFFCNKIIKDVFNGLNGAVVLYPYFCIIDGITCGSNIMRTY